MRTIKSLFIIFSLIFFTSCVNKEKPKKEIKENNTKKEDKSYIVAYYLYQYPFIYSNNRFDKVSFTDVEYKKEIVVSEVIEIKDYSQEKGYKILDKLYNDVYKILESKDEEYKKIHIPKIRKTNERRIAEVYKSKILEKKFKKFKKFKNASEYRFNLLN